jgi:ribosomal protein L31E
LSQRKVEITLNLRDAYKAPKRRRAKRALRIIKTKAARIVKAETVKISEEVSKYIYSYSVEKVPRKISLVIEKTEEGEAWVRLRGEEAGQ